MSAEKTRLEQAREQSQLWKKWGPYLSERQWGTVREDYSDSGDAWNYFTHDQSRARAYRWGEDGLAGISDDHQRLCFALALWNGNDPIIKERLFGLTNSEGNHGEDVKEYYFYLDSTPTHSYMKYLYKYPQNAFPYDNLVRTNRDRRRTEPEYELLDTGIFNENRYFDVFVEYAKGSPEDILIQITVYNRGPEAASLNLLPTLWFRNTWSWSPTPAAKPSLKQIADGIVEATDPELGTRYLYAPPGQFLFTENETNRQALTGEPNDTPYKKDAINNYFVHRRQDAVNPARTGTKVASWHVLNVPAGGSASIRLRLSDMAPKGKQKSADPLSSDFETTMNLRRAEADEFYSEVIPKKLDKDQALVMRQAIAGMLWSKQFYYYDLDAWLTERNAGQHRKFPRNNHWQHMYNADIISMPDKWEYPWYAAWDLAFHVIALTVVDEDFGKQQLDLLLQSNYLHPSGQIPAYEWNFNDVNPPVHAWSTIFTYRLDVARNKKGDREWLERVYQKLLMNFTWWVNRKDRTGSNLFEGGFLGLDNIGVFDRSAPLPTGGYLDQADGTAWMALYCQNMLEIAAELSLDRPAYLSMVQKFVEHFLWIGYSMLHSASGGGGTGMWDEEDGFFYDVLRLPDGSAHRLKVRSMVGLLPFCAATVFESDILKESPETLAQLRRFLASRPELTQFIHDVTKTGVNNRKLASILNEKNLRRVLSRMLDEKEFFSDYGIRSLSKCHCEKPYTFHADGKEFCVPYLPGESDTGMFGGNSNWRGPIWMPVNALIVRGLLQYYLYYGNDFTVECPTGSGNQMNLYQVAQELARRLSNIFLRDKSGRRAVNADIKTFQEDPHWRDLVLFYEYFHGDTGAGLGASHQTGWTGVIARTLHLFATVTPEAFLAHGKNFADTVAAPAVIENVARTHPAAGGRSKTTAETKK